MTRPNHPIQDRSASRREITSLRAPANSYLKTMFVGSFFACLSGYLELEVLSYSLVAISILLLPALAVSDRLVFDGKRLYRSGILKRFWAHVSGTRFWLKVKDIEQVETRCYPAFKRGGRVTFRYRTTIRGRDSEYIFSSGVKGYRELAQKLFRSVPEEILDAVSIEIRDYAAEPAAARSMARRSSIPPADVLESTFADPSRRARRSRLKAPADAVNDNGTGLRLLGNQLRLSGWLLEALESFRRAAGARPNDAWLLFDFARCIQLFAGTKGDPWLERQAAAMMRLAEQRAAGDGRLLARLGECYFQLGQWHRARVAFQKAADMMGDRYRAVRGMAEIALREGKLAHVVLNFDAAGELAGSAAARRWSRGEAEYFSRLNSDDEYLEMEIGRINLLDALRRWGRTAFVLTLIGFPLIALGMHFEEPTTANAGWTLSSSMLVLWIVFRIGSRIFVPRIDPRLLQDPE
jgi:tetratricopeptide (TPR) repeat protein